MSRLIATQGDLLVIYLDSLHLECLHLHVSREQGRFQCENNRPLAGGLQGLYFVC